MILVKTALGDYGFHTMPEAEAFARGYNHALDTFGIYRNGTQVIGCMEKPIRDKKLYPKDFVMEDGKPLL